MEALLSVSLDPVMAAPAAVDLEEDQFDLEDGSRSCRGLAASSFVKKLFDMVEKESPDIICWLEDGLTFEVKDPKRLEVEVLPRFFRHSRFQSLVRQLNFYAFKKVSKERSSWVYSHECFQRGHPELLESLRRKTSRAEFGPDSRSMYSPGTSSPYKRSRDLDMHTGEIMRTHSDSLTDDASTEDDINNRKRSSTVTDDIMHNWENVIGFFHAQSNYLRPLSVSSPTDGSPHSLPAVDSVQLESIRSQLRERGTGDTAIAIILFCLNRNPWTDSKALFYDIFHFLTHNSKLTDDINGYSEALSPSPSHRGYLTHLRDPSSYALHHARLDEQKMLKMRQRYARSLSMGDCDELDMAKRSPTSEAHRPLHIEIPKDGVPESLHRDGILRENEATIMRAFMSFAVTNLQTAASTLGDHENAICLNECSAIWQNYAQIHS